MLAGGPRISRARRADQWGFRAASKSPYRAMRCGLRPAREASAEQVGLAVSAVRVARVAWAVLVGQAVREASAEQAGLVVPAVRGAQVPSAELAGRVD
jgi:hypothetical protein